MTAGSAFRKFSKTAEKWRDLAEQRREYFRELHRTGRWRLYYSEDEFIARLRDVAGICDRWHEIVEISKAAAAEPAGAIERRNAA